MKVIERAILSIRSRGLIPTIKVVLAILEDKLFDWRYGVRTSRHIKLKALAIESQSKSFGIEYQPSRAPAFMRLMKILNLPRNGVFVDYGCGMGRILLLAAIFGFKNIQGVEFSPELCAIARDNVASYLRRRKNPAGITVIAGDALGYKIPNEASVFYMFHPFTGPVMVGILERIRQSLDTYPRKAWLIYSFPECGELVERYAKPTTVRTLECAGVTFAVYDL